MPTDDREILDRQIVRMSRPPMSGSRMNASTGGILLAGSGRTNTMVDENNQVRRRWMPGDPWTSDYFFGGGDTA